MIQKKKRKKKEKRTICDPIGRMAKQLSLRYWVERYKKRVQNDSYINRS
jgi:hypothetical protein